MAIISVVYAASLTAPKENSETVNNRFLELLYTANTSRKIFFFPNSILLVLLLIVSFCLFSYQLGRAVQWQSVLVLVQELQLHHRCLQLLRLVPP